MTPLTFEARYDAEWTELEALVAEAQGQRWRLLATTDQGASGHGVRLAVLYRRACGHLALARARAYPAHLVERLERVTSDAHQLIYQRHDLGWRDLWHLIAVAFPAAVRAHRSYVTVSALVFLVPTLVIGLLVYWRSELILSVVSATQAAEFEQMYSTTADSIGRTRTASTDWMMFGFYIRNNIGIAFQCFAGGLFAGVGSLFFLAFNGAFGGALAGYLTERGLSATFWPFVATHSAFELTAIVLSGAAGLRMGHALLSPGRRTRRQALVQATRDAIVIVYGVTVLLVIAAAVEAFWSSSRWVPPPVKFAAAALCWTSVIVYFVRQGRAAGDGNAA